MTASLSWDQFVDGLRAGDERVVAAFCARYGPHLVGVADRHIAPRLRRRVGPESVVQSACCSFLRRVGAGQFELADSEHLWRLLCAITLRKIRQGARFHGRERRDVALDAAERVPAPGSAPEEALAIAEEFEALLNTLDDEERRIVELKLEERSNPEVAAALGCSERTVRRLMAGLRAKLERALSAA